MRPQDRKSHHERKKSGGYAPPLFGLVLFYTTWALIRLVVPLLYPTESIPRGPRFFICWGGVNPPRIKPLPQAKAWDRQERGMVSPALRFGVSYTTCALIRLVVPLLPMGTPAVMTTVSPHFTAPSLRATSTLMENRRSVESTKPVR